MELCATYRLQLGPGLDFRRALELVPYLRELGVSHLYLSPAFRARSGSTHGYDVVDPRELSEALGGEEAFRALAGAGLGVVLDIVPNHMANSEEENPFWGDPELRKRFFDLDPDTGRHRRFFDIDELAGVRVEDPEVFEQTHALVIRLVREGLVDGVRVDHPDGLAAPGPYLARLRDSGVERIWVEKILEPGEDLRHWPVEGTTGYEFLNDVAALFVDPAGEPALTALHAELSGDERPFQEVAAEAKLQQATTTFTPEVERLARLLDAEDLPAALASFPVYRTYVDPERGHVEDADRRAVAAADLPERLRRVLLLEDRGHDEFVVRFQQTTGPVMAKGVEDTAFYRYNRLVALNDVGGDPGRFGLSVAEFHRANAKRAERTPRGLLTSQTHDTKRSGDTRARIGELAGIGEEWAGHVRRWRELNAPLRSDGAPDANEEHLIYQALIGTWPIEPERLQGYVEKALREEKTHTAWVDGDPEWEAAVQRFCAGLYEHEAFLADFEPIAEQVARLGERAALGQLLIKLTAPGVPDIYQGDELWSLSLVDPDNRRPIDWEHRHAALEAVRTGAEPARDTVKLWLIRRALELRGRRPEAFAGGYTALEAGEELCAYLRGGDVLVAVPVRHRIPEGTLELPEGRWHDVLAEKERSGTVVAAELVATHPGAAAGGPFGALLERAGS